MSTKTWLNEQARIVRGALTAGHLDEAREALRSAFEDGDGPEGIRPDMVIRLALFPLADATLDVVRAAFEQQAERTFIRSAFTPPDERDDGAGDDLDAEIRSALYAALYEDRDRA